MPVRRPSLYATHAAATSCTPLPLESKITNSSSVVRPCFRPATRSASSAWTWSFDKAPARSAWLRSPPEAQASMSSTSMRARRMSAGAISCCSGLSAPMAATKHPFKSKSSVRIGDFDVVQVTQISASATAAATLAVGLTGQLAVDPADANAWARAASMSKTRTISLAQSIRHSHSS
jgi:hypothetical protein